MNVLSSVKCLACLRPTRVRVVFLIVHGPGGGGVAITLPAFLLPSLSNNPLSTSANNRYHVFARIFGFNVLKHGFCMEPHVETQRMLAVSAE